MQNLTADSLVYDTFQLDVTRWLRNELGMQYDAPVYFDDADLVYIDKTVVRSALVRQQLTLGDLRTALQQHIAKL